MDLVRAVLLKVEKLPHDYCVHDVAVEGYEEDEITYHIRLLHEAGLIEAQELTTMTSIGWKPKRLTWAGHEFLDSARSDTVWQKAKDAVQKATGTLTLEGLKMALPEIAKRLISGQLGIG